MAADRGAFIDQSQSLNIHIAEPNMNKLSSMHFYAWKKVRRVRLFLSIDKTIRFLGSEDRHVLSPYASSGGSNQIHGGQEPNWFDHENRWNDRERSGSARRSQCNRRTQSRSTNETVQRDRRGWRLSDVLIVNRCCFFLSGLIDRSMSDRHYLEQNRDRAAVHFSCLLFSPR